MLAIEAVEVTKRFGPLGVLDGLTLRVAPGEAYGLLGANGAGKTTLLHLAAGLLRPTTGSIAVLGGRPGEDPHHLARIGFVAQDTPTYASMTVADHLDLGAWLNPGWDAGVARRRIHELGLDPRQAAGKLSGGQRAQLALTLAVAKRPELLILDEPLASLDPLARRDFLRILMDVVAAEGVSVILSSHLVADLERICDFLIVLVSSRVQVSGEIDDLLATHRRLVGQRRDGRPPPPGQQIVHASHTDRQTTLVARLERPVFDPAWAVEEIDLEDLVLAYMSSEPAGDLAHQTILRVVG